MWPSHQAFLSRFICLQHDLFSCESMLVYFCETVSGGCLHRLRMLVPLWRLQSVAFGADTWLVWLTTGRRMADEWRSCGLKTRGFDALVQRRVWRDISGDALGRDTLLPGRQGQHRPALAQLQCRRHLPPRPTQPPPLRARLETRLLDQRPRKASCHSPRRIEGRPTNTN